MGKFMTSLVSGGLTFLVLLVVSSLIFAEMKPFLGRLVLWIATKIATIGAGILPEEQREDFLLEVVDDHVKEAIADGRYGSALLRSSAEVVSLFDDAKARIAAMSDLDISHLGPKIAGHGGHVGALAIASAGLASWDDAWWLVIAGITIFIASTALTSTTVTLGVERSVPLSSALFSTAVVIPVSAVVVPFDQYGGSATVLASVLGAVGGSCFVVAGAIAGLWPHNRMTLVLGGFGVVVGLVGATGLSASLAIHGFAIEGLCAFGCALGMAVISLGMLAHLNPGAFRRLIV